MILDSDHTAIEQSEVHCSPAWYCANYKDWDIKSQVGKRRKPNSQWGLRRCKPFLGVLGEAFQETLRMSRQNDEFEDRGETGGSSVIIKNRQCIFSRYASHPMRIRFNWSCVCGSSADDPHYACPSCTVGLFPSSRKIYTILSMSFCELQHCCHSATGRSRFHCQDEKRRSRRHTGVLHPPCR